MPSIAIVFSQPIETAFELAGRVGERNLYRKELIYADNFSKKKEDGTFQEFTVTEEDLDEWLATGMQMLSNGVEIPMPIEHTTDPEKNRGGVVGFERGINKSGKPALYGLSVFRDAEAEQLAKTANVSIFVPPEFTDGKKNVYRKPIRHVALTDYPVVPGLNGFEAIVASHIIPKEPDMAMSSLAKAVGVEVKEGDDDAAIEKAIVAAFTALKKKPSTSPTKPVDKPAIAAGFISMARDARETKLNTLASKGHITVAVANKLKEQYCTDESLQLSLTAEGDTTDGFDRLVETLKENDPLVIGEQTGPQTVLELSNSDLLDSKKNPLLADADKRAKAGA